MNETVKFTGPIKTPADRVRFFDALLGAGLNFHPDTPFDDYVDNDTSKRVYSLASTSAASGSGTRPSRYLP